MPVKNSREPNESSTTRLIRQLQQDNKMLKRDIARLEKSLRRYQGQSEGENDDEPEVVKPPTVAVGVLVCEMCSSQDLVEIETPNKVLIVCKDCKHRFHRTTLAQ